VIAAQNVSPAQAAKKPETMSVFGSAMSSFWMMKRWMMKSSIYEQRDMMSYCYFKQQTITKNLERYDIVIGRKTEAKTTLALSRHGKDWMRHHEHIYQLFDRGELGKIAFQMI